MQALRSPNGFSFIELVAAMGIIAVLSAIAVPAVSSLRRKASLVSAEREVMSVLYRTRSGAIASSAARRVVFTPPTSIQVTDFGGTTTYFTADLDGYHSDVDIANPITVTYDARGLLNPPSTVTLTLQDTAGQLKTITIYPTGKPVAN
jgi:prepilin-type N-terminal cleavage/methylation domain-containing protein